MAKQLARLKDFFEGKRRRCTLDDYKQLKSAGNENRMKLMVTMPLSNQPVDGIPGEFAEEYALMNKKDSATNFKKVSVEVKAATFTIFSTDTIRNHVVRSGSCTLNSFRLIGHGVEEKRTVSLEFVVYIPWSEGLHAWCAENLHGDFFCETIPSQMELVEDEPEKPAKGKKKDKRTEFDPDAIQKAAKQGELIQ
jgi:hypothetical protein